jgi:YVTN family beta-propeller protein
MRFIARLAFLSPLLLITGCAHSIRPALKPVTTEGATPGSSVTLPGRQPDGSMLLPNGWSLRPAGRQIELGDFPVNIAVHPAGRYAAVLHAGFSQHEVVIVDLRKARVVSRTKLKETFYGIAFSSDGQYLFCSGAGDENIHVLTFEKGNITDHREIPLRNPASTGVPAGLAVDSKTERVFAANLWGNSISAIEMRDQLKISEIQLAASSATPVATTNVIADTDTAAADKRAAAARIVVHTNDTFPFTCLLDEKKNRLYVSLWAQAAVAVIDLASSRVIARWPTQDHPCEMTLTHSGKYLFVANANQNTVSVLDTATGAAVETIWAALYPQSPPGSTPNSLALSPDDGTLFVANANINAVAVFDVSIPGRSHSLGFIPVGWYPTSVRVTPDGKHLLVANGKGVTPRANPHGPQPGIRGDTTVQYIGRLLRGTLAIIDLPARAKFARQLADDTATVYRCSPLKSDAGVQAAVAAPNPVPQQPGAASPIRYCIYVIKENRTYDQVFGDLRAGNGDPSLCLFPENITPNHHKLAREFVLLDNFYAEAEVSAGGHEWSMGAYATDFVEKTWRLDYGHNSAKFPYPSEGDFPVAFPSTGYLWDRAKDAGVSYRSYGEFVYNGKTTNDPCRTKLKNLQDHFDPQFRSFDLNYPDARRADRFIAELHRFETEGDMPRLQILRLPNDHTHGATKGFPTPTAYVIDNDVALGRVVEAVSHSRFWPETAIFVVEDDAQNGPDHVDAHRTVALAISPYTRRGTVDSTLYSTTSMLRTMELILGFAPMTQFDAAATPMFNAFQATPDVHPYDAVLGNASQPAATQRNPATAWGANLAMDFSHEDAVDDLLLNEAVWRAVRGAEQKMPSPVRAGFVFAHTEKDDD